MKRNIIRIDEAKCSGCGKCVRACAEGALKMVEGKARLVSEVYCDGLGACIGDCPTGALTIEAREADEFDEKAVASHVGQAPEPVPACPSGPGHSGGCPGSMARSLKRDAAPAAPGAPAASQLVNWPVQLKLAPPTAPYFQDADLLVCADCVPYALADFHRRLLKGRTVVIGCPKLDDVEFYVQKLSAILKGNDIRSITVAHMEVPCCTGIVYAVHQAIEQSGKKDIPMHDLTVGIDGSIQVEEWNKI